MNEVGDMDLLPGTSGAYAVIIRLGRRLRAWPASGPVLIPGLYLYAGSARGPGGIRARVRRHARSHKRRHWHLDRLTASAPVVAVAAMPGGDECRIVGAALLVPGVKVPAPGFGSSDCRSCPAHLLALPPGINDRTLSCWFPDATWWWRTNRPGL